MKPPSPEIPDEDYARLSAEKQVFEKSKNRGNKTSQTSKEEKEEEDKSGSEGGSSVNLGVVAGEVKEIRSSSFLVVS